MKVKRLVAVLLAALLLVGMIPMNALATFNRTGVGGPDTETVIEIQTFISDTAPVTTGLEYSNSYSGDDNILQANLDKANGAWTPSKTGEVSVAADGKHLVYIGVKTSLVSSPTYKGITNVGMALQYNPDVLVPAQYNAMSGAMSMARPDRFVDSQFQASVILNDVTKGVANKEFGSDYSTYDDDPEAWKKVLKYCAAASVAGGTADVTEEKDAFTGYISLTLNLLAASNTTRMAMASGTTWDFVIPMYVKSGATGSSDIQVVAGEYGNDQLPFVSIQLCSGTLDGFNQVNTNENIKAFNYNYNTSALNDVKVKVAAPDIEIPKDENDKKLDTVAVDGEGNVTLQVALNEFVTTGWDATEAAKADNWHVTQDGQNPIVSKAEVTGDTVTLTITKAAAGTIKVSAESGVISGNSSNLSELSYTAAKVPTVTIDYDNKKVETDEENVVILLGNDNPEEEKNWIPVSSANGAALDEAAIQKILAADGKITVALSSNKSISGVITAKIKTAPTAATLTIDYEGETTNENGNGLEIKKAENSYEAAGDNKKIELTPGTDLVVRTAGDGTALPSKDYTLEVKAAPVLSSDTKANADAEKLGKTDITLNPATGPVYVIDTDSTLKDVPSSGTTAWDASKNPIDLTTGQYLHAQIPASNTTQTFKSNAVVVTGRGRDYAEVKTTSYTLTETEGQTITLELVGPSSITWVDDATKLTLDPSSDAFKIKSFVGGVVTFEGTPAKGQNYKLTVTPDAVNGKLNSDNSSTEVTLNGPSDNAVTVKIVDTEGNTYTVTPATVSAGTVEPVELTVNLPKGQSVESVVSSSDESKLTAEVKDGKLLATTGTFEGKPEVTLTITIGYTTPVLSGDTISGLEQGDTDTTISVTNYEDFDDLTVTSSDPDVATATYDKDTGEITVTGGTKGGTVTITVANGDAKAEITVTVLKEVTDVKVGTPSVKEGTIDSVADQVANTEVTVTVDGDKEVKKKLSDLIDKETIAEAIKDALQAKADEEAAKAVEEEAKAAYDKAVEEGETEAYEDWIKTATKEDGGDTWKDLIDNAAAPEVTTVPTGELDLSAIADMIDSDVIDAMIAADQDNFADTKTADDVNIDADSLKSVNVTKKSSGTPSSGPNVNLETNGWATPDGPVELDESGKITKLPGVIGQKLGTVFKGWATQAGNANTIVKEGREITGDTTLYGIFEGYMNGDYNANNQRTARPGDPVTRGELLTMLVRAAGIYDDSVDYNTTFADAKGAWYTSYVGCAEEAGILAGDKEGTARPKDYITREEAAIFIAKTFNVTVPEGGTTEYVVDFADTATWAKDYVAALVNNGTAVGNDKQEYEPKKNITRAEVAAMINKYIGLTQTKKTALSGSASSPFVDVQNKNSWFYAEMIFASLNAPENYYVTEVTYPSR